MKDAAENSSNRWRPCHDNMTWRKRKRDHEDTRRSLLVFTQKTTLRMVYGKKSNPSAPLAPPRRASGSAKPVNAAGAATVAITTKSPSAPPPSLGQGPPLRANAVLVDAYVPEATRVEPPVTGSAARPPVPVQGQPRYVSVSCCGGGFDLLKSSERHQSQPDLFSLRLNPSHLRFNKKGERANVRRFATYDPASQSVPEGQGGGKGRSMCDAGILFLMFGKVSCGRERERERERKKERKKERNPLKKERKKERKKKEGRASLTFLSTPVALLQQEEQQESRACQRDRTPSHNQCQHSEPLLLPPPLPPSQNTMKLTSHPVPRLVLRHEHGHMERRLQSSLLSDLWRRYLYRSSRCQGTGQGLCAFRDFP